MRGKTTEFPKRCENRQNNYNQVMVLDGSGVVIISGFCVCLFGFFFRYAVLRSFMFVLSCVCYAFVYVCLYVLCGHQLGKG